jgi:hypothetical protein
MKGAKDAEAERESAAARAAPPAAPPPPAVAPGRPAPAPASVRAGAPPVPAAPGAPFIDRGLPIPAHYHEDRLVALVRDPEWIFVYWELEGSGCQKLADRFGAEFLRRNRWVVRVATLAEGGFYDVQVEPAAKNWYLQVRPDGRYQFEIGVLTPDGRFFLLARSEEVRTPTLEIGESAEGAWVVPDAEFETIIQAMGGRAALRPGASPVGAPGARAVRRIGAVTLPRQLFASGTVQRPRPIESASGRPRRPREAPAAAALSSAPGGPGAPPPAPPPAPMTRAAEPARATAALRPATRPATRTAARTAAILPSSTMVPKVIRRAEPAPPGASAPSVTSSWAAPAPLPRAAEKRKPPTGHRRRKTDR